MLSINDLTRKDACNKTVTLIKVSQYDKKVRLRNLPWHKFRVAKIKLIARKDKK